MPRTVGKRPGCWLVRPDDVVLLKGSHGMEVFKLIDEVFRKGDAAC